MKDTKAPSKQRELTAESESWNKLPWRKLEQQVYRIQKRIFRAEQRGNPRAVHKLQKLLVKSRAARLLAVRRVTQDNQGKHTAGIDGIKSVPAKERLRLAEDIHPRNWTQYRPQPVRRVYIPKPGKAEKRPPEIPVMGDRAQQAVVKLALEPQWEARFDPNSYGFRPGRGCHDAEEFLYTHPKMLDVQVIGVPDEKYGEEIMAWIKVKSGEQLTEEEIKAYCRDQIAHYKIPRYVKFVESFPMTVTGKIQKFLMRKQAIEENL